MRGGSAPTCSVHSLSSPPTYQQALHLTGTHGKRYEVDQNRQQELRPLVHQGRRQIRDSVAANLSVLVFQGQNEFEQAALGAVSLVK